MNCYGSLSDHAGPACRFPSDLSADRPARQKTPGSEGEGKTRPVFRKAG